MYQLIHLVATLYFCHLWNPEFILGSGFLDLSIQLISSAFWFLETFDIYIFFLVNSSPNLDLFIHLNIFLGSYSGSQEWKRGDHCTQFTILIQYYFWSHLFCFPSICRAIRSLESDKSEFLKIISDKFQDTTRSAICNGHIANMRRSFFSLFLLELFKYIFFSEMESLLPRKIMIIPGWSNCTY